MKKTIMDNYFHLGSKQFFIAVFVIFLLGGYTSSAQQGGQSGRKISPDKVLSGEELRKTNPISLWDAIRQLEPAISETDENSYGSDPNNLPVSVEIRGSNHWPSVQPALPVFILDNSIVDIRRIYDLNINDVAEVIIRKDAASLTSYGLRGGRSVIEVKTVRPESGSIRLSYSFDGAFQWADLNSYHLLNSKDKLGIEKQAGLYLSEDPTEQQKLQRLLSEREGIVSQGTNTNWLQVPLQTAFSHRHKIDVYGGDDFIRYKFTLRASPNTEGVMKESKRDIYGADAYLEYRYRSLTLSNQISVDKLYTKASPYGDFSYYTRMNPYFTGYDNQGLLYPGLGEGSFNGQANPFYEVSLSSLLKKESMHLYDNFKASYSFLDKFRLEGGFTFLRDQSQEDSYISPDSYIFSTLSPTESREVGKYQISHNNRLTYEGRVKLEYDGNCNRSSYGASIGMEVFQGKYDYDIYAGIGIPIDRMGFISFTTAYDPTLKPNAREEYDRMLSGLLSAYYSFDSRYQAQLYMRIDKSSLLAPKNRRAAFYGASAQWNLYREKFLQQCSSLDRLTLQASVGTAGNIDFNEYAHSLMYNYNIGNEYIYNYYLIGSRINSLVNPSLKWSTTQNKNISLQAEAKGISLFVNYYNNTTRNLPVIAPATLATGFDVMPDNGGGIRNSGIEYSLSFNILNRADGIRLNLFTTGIHNKNKIISLPEFYQNYYNQEECRRMESEQKRPTLLVKGESVNSIYAVSSLGLDANGRETFRTRDGKTNPLCNSADLTAMGETTPKLKGTFGFQFSWNQWQLNTHFNYSTGGKIYNETLAEIQNGNSAYNMDNRALDKTIKATNPEYITTTSRFVEKRNEIGLGTLRVGYSIKPETATKLYLQQLNIYLTGNNLFYHSSADYQRGTIYPFARTVTLSLRATF